MKYPVHPVHPCLNCRVFLAVLLAVLAIARSSGRATEAGGRNWVEPMREVHARFRGQRGTFAQFGDSITVTQAFWAPLQHSSRNAPPEMQEALSLVRGHLRPACWRDWKGPEYGSDGTKTVRWAHEQIGEWLRKLNPEVALLMFGSNDVQSLELEEYREKLRAVVQRCLENGTVVILSTIPPRHGFESRSAAFAQAAREIARELRVPLTDYHAEILRRRPDDWNGALDRFHEFEGYDVPTLISRDGVHPSHPRRYQNDYSEEALRSSGYSLRNYLALMKYAEVIRALGAGADRERENAKGVEHPPRSNSGSCGGTLPDLRKREEDSPRRHGDTESLTGMDRMNRMGLWMAAGSQRLTVPVGDPENTCSTSCPSCPSLLSASVSLRNSVSPWYFGAFAPSLPSRLRALHREAPPLPAPKGEVIRVSTVEELFAAAARVKPGGTIMVADGEYRLTRRLEIRTDGVTLRGASGRRERVVLDGGGIGELVAVTACSGVTIADLTVQNVQWNGIKINSETGVHRLTIYNCVLRNIWQRAVKGVLVPAKDRERLSPRGHRIQYCLFTNDRPKRFSDDPADTAENFGGNYIGGIDTMFARDWVISDNVFVGIQGRTRGARGAIFVWHDSRDCVIERNVIVDCDSGICLGNSHKPADVAIHCTGFIVRNNFVTRAPENGILADYTRDCQILNNTVHDPANRLGRLIRLVHDNDGLQVVNNLLSGPSLRNESDSRMTLRNNLEGERTAYFVDPQAGNLRLTARASAAIDRAVPLPEVTDDIDRQPRGARRDIGAHEFEGAR